MSTDSAAFWRGLAAGGVAGVVFTLLGVRASQSKCDKAASGVACGGKPAEIAVSTTNSGVVPAASGGAVNVYETATAVSEYIMFHYGDPKDVLPYAIGPHDALQFPQRTAALCEEYCKKFGVPLRRALDVGCAVGGASFALSKHFDAVVGIDFSHAFVNTSNSLKTARQVEYTFTVEGEIKDTKLAKLSSDSRPEVCSFEQGDACNIRADIGTFSVVHAVNLLCRLPNPRAFLDRLASLVEPRGLVVLISPYSWLPGYTARDNWMGGKLEDGKPVYTKRSLLDLMEPEFELVHDGEVPFLIREHARKFQWGISNALVWRRR